MYQGPMNFVLNYSSGSAHPDEAESCTGRDTFTHCMDRARSVIDKYNNECYGYCEPKRIKGNAFGLATNNNKENMKELEINNRSKTINGKPVMLFKVALRCSVLIDALEGNRSRTAEERETHVARLMKGHSLETLVKHIRHVRKRLDENTKWKRSRFRNTVRMLREQHRELPKREGKRRRYFNYIRTFYLEVNRKLVARGNSYPEYRLVSRLRAGMRYEVPKTYKEWLEDNDMRVKPTTSPTIIMNRGALTSLPDLCKLRSKKKLRRGMFYAFLKYAKRERYTMTTERARELFQTFVRQHKTNAERSATLGRKPSKPIRDLLPLFATSGEMEFRRYGGNMKSLGGGKMAWETEKNGKVSRKTFTSKMLLNPGFDGGGQPEVRMLLIPAAVNFACKKMVDGPPDKGKDGGHIHCNFKGNSDLIRRANRGLVAALTWVRFLAAHKARRAGRFASVKDVNIGDLMRSGKFSALNANQWETLGTVEWRIFDGTHIPTRWLFRGKLVAYLCEWATLEEECKEMNLRAMIDSPSDTRGDIVKAFEVFIKWVKVVKKDKPFLTELRNETEIALTREIADVSESASDAPACKVMDGMLATLEEQHPKRKVESPVKKKAAMVIKLPADVEAALVPRQSVVG